MTSLSGFFANNLTSLYRCSSNKPPGTENRKCSRDVTVSSALYLPTGDFFVVNDEPVGHGRGQLDGLQPETNVTLLQNLIVEPVLQRNDCRDTDAPTMRGVQHLKDTRGLLLRDNAHLDV